MNVSWVRSSALSPFFLLTLCTLTLIAFSPAVEGAVHKVTKTSDSADGVCDEDCSLREAIIASNSVGGLDVIVLGKGTYTLSIPGGSGPEIGDLDIVDDVEIHGQGPALTVINGNRIDRVFDIRTGRALIEGLTITGGREVSGFGGGIEVEPGAELTLEDVVVRGNEAADSAYDGGGIANFGKLQLRRTAVVGNNVRSGDGGGLFNAGVAIVESSTVSDNTADAGAGLRNEDRMELINVTVANNAASEAGGGLSNLSELTTLHVTLSNNKAASGSAVESGGSWRSANTLVSGSCSLHGGGIDSKGGNFESPRTSCRFRHANDRMGVAHSELEIGHLGDNAGTTETVPLRDGSVAIASAMNTYCAQLDQRGFSRGDGGCDIGAFEVSSKSTCRSSETVLCIDGKTGDSRFELKLNYSTTQGGGRAGSALALPLEALGVSDGGLFSFFSQKNPELLVKILDGCAINGRYWVFYSAATNLGFDLSITDRISGAKKLYQNRDGDAALTQTDVEAFSCR